MDWRDQSSECVRPYCWRIRFCKLAHERKLGLASPAMLRLHVFVVMRDTHEQNPFNLQMNEQSGVWMGVVGIQVTHLV